MSYYEVLLSDNDNAPVSIFEPDKKEMTLLNATVSLAIREAGYFDFSIPPHHVFADSIKPYGSTIEVRENGQTIFFGRPLPPTTDFWGNKTYHCEGALAFLTDVVLPPMGFLGEMTVGELIEATIDEYNKHQTRVDREFRYSISDFPSVTIYEPDDWNYQTALDYIRKYLFQFCGGFFYAEWDGTEILLKWKSELTEKNDQPVELGLNLIEMMRTGKSFYTAAIARGGQNADGVEAHMMTPKYASNALRNEYGTIVAYLEHPETTAVDALEAYCETFLEEQQFNGSVLEITAADLSLQEDNVYEEFRLEQLVHVTSRPQGIDATLPITRLEIDINSAAKRAVIGTLDVVPLTISTMKVQVQAEKKAKEIAKKVVDKDNAKAKPTTIKGSDGNDYGLDVDTDGNVFAVRVPAKIEFTRSVMFYIQGQQFDHTKYEVTATFGNGDRQNVTEQCSYSIEDGYTFAASGNPDELVATYAAGVGTLTASTAVVVIKNNEEPQTSINSILPLSTTMDFALALSAKSGFELDLVLQDEVYQATVRDYGDKPNVVSCGYYGGWNSITIAVALDLNIGDPIDKITRMLKIRFTIYQHQTYLDSYTIEENKKTTSAPPFTLSDWYTFIAKHTEYQHVDYYSSLMGSINMVGD